MYGAPTGSTGMLHSVSQYKFLQAFITRLPCQRPIHGVETSHREHLRAYSAIERYCPSLGTTMPAPFETNHDDSEVPRLHVWAATRGMSIKSGPDHTSSAMSTVRFTNSSDGNLPIDTIRVLSCR